MRTNRPSLRDLRFKRRQVVALDCSRCSGLNQGSRPAPDSGKSVMLYSKVSSTMQTQPTNHESAEDEPGDLLRRAQDGDREAQAPCLSLPSIHVAPPPEIKSVRGGAARQGGHVGPRPGRMLGSPPALRPISRNHRS